MTLAKAKPAGPPKQRGHRYVVRPGAGGLTDRDAAVVAREANAMLAAGRAVKREAIVDAARNPASPLHRLFEWDDAKAAEGHRLDRAGELLAAIRIVSVNVTTREVEPAKYLFSGRAMNEATGKVERSYHTRETVLASADLQAQVSSDCYDRVMAAIRCAEDAGLMEADKAWGIIAACVRRNMPSIGMLAGPDRRRRQ